MTFGSHLPCFCRPLLPFAVREQLAANLAKAERGETDTSSGGPLAKHIKKSIEEHKTEIVPALKRWVCC